MKKIYDCMNENTGFVYYEAEGGELRFADNASDIALTAPIDPQKVVWNDHLGWIFEDGSELPWAE